ncbi:MAG: metallophosphoesterase [Clostridia bacterium]|nr:metallophosphoesterase [Clostridia bacterium]
MKKILVVSDTHGNTKGLEKLRPLIEENDYLVHLGDGAGDVREYMRDFPEKVCLCGGNCDFFGNYPDEGVLEIESVKILYCHGHKYRVKSTLETLASEAKKRDCDIALYGHTHTSLVSEIDGVTLINPGSLSRPVGKGGSYCYLVINGSKHTEVIVGESVF